MGTGRDPRCRPPARPDTQARKRLRGTGPGRCRWARHHLIPQDLIKPKERRHLPGAMERQRRGHRARTVTFEPRTVALSRLRLSSRPLPTRPPAPHVHASAHFLPSAGREQVAQKPHVRSFGHLYGAFDQRTAKKHTWPVPYLRLNAAGRCECSGT